MEESPLDQCMELVRTHHRPYLQHPDSLSGVRGGMQVKVYLLRKPTSLFGSNTDFKVRLVLCKLVDVTSFSGKTQILNREVIG